MALNRDAFDRFTSKTPAWYYEVIAPGRSNTNMTDIASAMGATGNRPNSRVSSRGGGFSPLGITNGSPACPDAAG